MPGSTTGSIDAIRLRGLYDPDWEVPRWIHLPIRAFMWFLILVLVLLVAVCLIKIAA